MRDKTYIQKKRMIKKIILCKEKGDKCSVCKMTFSYHLYEFHHLDPTEKDIEIGKLLSSGVKLEQIRKEIDKCILICPVCHKELHNENLLNKDILKRISYLIDEHLEDYKNKKGQIKYKKMMEGL